MHICRTSHVLFALYMSSIISAITHELTFLCCFMIAVSLHLQTKVTPRCTFQFVCAVLGRTAITESDKLQLGRIHCCHLCSYMTEKLFNLKVHFRTHTGERPFKCHFCPQTFSQSPHLKSHLRCHTGERPYQCKVCSQKFTARYNLKSHMRLHTGERPYHCSVCSESFVQRGQWSKHMRMYHIQNTAQ